ncbi:DNA damage-induced apoptosis suppressor protein-like isoform X1 [Huso huso]|uniref:DNA damage-induced apoptosis suppressor protein-like isoform X1 n=1 Tax=Huso huso TaxID=61971 RepID=A0ABR0ZNB4_HUSHU
MNGKRIPIDGSVLSVQDSCFFYPSCQNCMSRLTRNHNRCACIKCGYTCEADNVHYRYRLSLQAAQKSEVFSVTVFGGCLDPLFGVTAGFLQRYSEGLKKDARDPQNDRVHSLLTQAVEDCFIGRSFIFGVKFSRKQARIHTSYTKRILQTSLNTYGSPKQLVACQIAVPNTAVLGCTVISYFKALLQSVNLGNVLSVSQPLGSSPAAEDLHSPEVCSSLESSLADSGQSFTQPSKGDSFQGPWQQSLGLITSSAEGYSGSDLSSNTKDISKWDRRSGSIKSPKNHCISECTHVQCLPGSGYSLVEDGNEKNLNDKKASHLYSGYSACSDASNGNSGHTRNAFANEFSCSSSSMTDPCCFSCQEFPDQYHKESRDEMQSELPDERDNDSAGHGLNDTWSSVFSGGDADVFWSQDEQFAAKRKSAAYSSVEWEHLPFSESLGEFKSKLEENGQIRTNQSDSYLNEDINHELTTATDSQHEKAHRKRMLVPRTTEAGLTNVHKGFASDSSLNPLDSQQGCLVANIYTKDRDVLKSHSFGNVESFQLKEEPAGNVELQDSSSTSGDKENHTTGVQFLRTGTRMFSSFLAQEFSAKDANAGACLKSYDCKKLYCSKDVITKHQHDIYVTGVCNQDFVKKEQPMQNNYRSFQDTYNGSADLFNSSDNTINTEELVNKSSIVLMTHSSPCGREPVQSVEHGTQQQPHYSLQILNEVLQRRSHCDSDNDFLDTLNFVPCSQSTPVSKCLATLQPYQSKGKAIPKTTISLQRSCNRRTSKRSLLTQHLLKQQHCRHLRSSFKIKGKRRKDSSNSVHFTLSPRTALSESDSEEWIPSSVKKSAQPCAAQGCTSSFMSCRVGESNHCKIILHGLANADEIPLKPNKNVQGSYHKGKYEMPVTVSKFKQTSVASTPIKNNENEACSNSQVSREHNKMTGYWSDDLFGQSDSSVP